MRFAIFAALLACLVPASGATIVLVPSKDNTLYEDPGGSLSNGQGEGMFVGTTGGGGLRRALVAFDLSSIPPGSIIESVQLRLTMTRGLNNITPVSLHTALASWGEGASSAGSSRDGGGANASAGDATWIHRVFPGALWTNAGGDFAASPRATTDVESLGTYAWQSAALAADVQAWLDAPATNHGWLIRGLEVGPGNAKRFATSEYATASMRPALEIIYTPVPEPGTAAMAGVAFAIVASRRARRCVSRSS